MTPTTLFCFKMSLNILGQKDGSVGRDSCCQAWWPEYDPRDSYSVRKYCIPTNCPLSSMCTLWHTCSHTIKFEKSNVFLFECNFRPPSSGWHHAIFPICLSLRCLKYGPRNIPSTAYIWSTYSSSQPSFFISKCHFLCTADHNILCFPH